MSKKEFKNTFKALVDGVADGLPLPRRLNKLAKRFSTAPETLEKWYNDVSAPANASKDLIIKHLYEEKKKRDFAEVVREVIRNELRVEVVQDPTTNDNTIGNATILLKLGDETIHTSYVDLNQ